MFTTILDLLGLGLLIAFAYVLFAPAALAIGGMACLAMSYRMTRR